MTKKAALAIEAARLKREAQAQRLLARLAKEEAVRKAEAERAAEALKPPPPPLPPPGPMDWMLDLPPMNPAPPGYPHPPIPLWLKQTLRSTGRDQIPPDFQVKFIKPNGDLHWASNIGAQTWSLLCPCDEILIGGRRGGSKSAALIAWFAMGDASLPIDDPAHYSLLNEKSFRGLMLRKEYQSMADFVDEALDFFRPFGVKATGGASSPVVFEFKSGAKIYTNHLGNAEAYEKYRGHGITKIGIEELTQIPEERWYLKLFGSLRNKKQVRIGRGGRTLPSMHCQILSTTNPDGVGKMWVKNRFVRVRSEGKLIDWNSPMSDKISGLTRIFIPMRREDNPYLRDDKQYLGQLMAQDEVTRKQWIDGDWDAGAGMYFSEFRPDGPVGAAEMNDMPWARHVVQPVELKPWWYRFGSLDIGFSHLSVAHKGCRNDQDGRIHVYEEMAVRQIGSYELGVLLAKWWIPDLEFLPDKQITLAVSPDAFSKTDASRTRAEQLADGIKAVLGPYGAFLLRYNDDERAAMTRDPKLAEMMFDRRKAEMARGQLCIALKPAQNDRIAGWSYMHELLRFRPIIAETQQQLEARLRQKFGQGGVEAYEKARAQMKQSGPEILPKLVLWPKCKEAIRGITEAQHDEPPRSEDVRKWDAHDGVGGDDGLDSCFGKNTLILIAHGQVPIQDIRVGDMVETRGGLRRVTAAGMTNESAELWELKASNGATLIGTGNHPVFVENHGFKRLDSLRSGDILHPWYQKPSSSMESNSGDIQSHGTFTSEITTGQAGITANAEWVRSIRRSGERLMERFLQGITFITPMRTPSIAISPILNASWPGSISQGTPERQRTGSECGSSVLSGVNMRRSGTAAPQGGSGIAFMPGVSSETGPELSGTATSAAELSSYRISSGDMRGSAETTANPNGGNDPDSTIFSRCVRYVAGVLSGTNTRRHVSVPEPVAVETVRPLWRRDAVYNLSVEGDHPEYFANGILVHNCRYLLMGYKDVAARIPKSYWVNDQIGKVQEAHVEAFGEEISDPTRLRMIALTQAARFDKQNGPKQTAFSLPRASSQRHRVN